MGYDDNFSGRDVVCVILAFLAPPFGVLFLRSGDPCWDDDDEPWNNWVFHQKYKWAMLTLVLTVAGFWICGTALALYVIYRFHGKNPNRGKKGNKANYDAGDKPHSSEDEGKAPLDPEKQGDGATDDPSQKEVKKDKKRTKEDERRMIEEGNQWEIGRNYSQRKSRVDPQIQAKREEVARKLRAKYAKEFARGNTGL